MQSLYHNSELEKPYPLARKFFFRVLPALVLLLGISVVLVGFVVRQTSESIYLQRATNTTNRIVSDVARKSPDPWKKFIGDKSLSKQDLSELAKAFAQEQSENRLIGLKVYDLERRVLFSHNTKETGTTENAEILLTVLKSQRPSVARHREKDGTIVFELYVPYVVGGQLLAVLELYETTRGGYQSTLYDTTVPVVSALLGMFLLLLLLFVPIVNHAQQAIVDRTAVIIDMRKRLERLLSRGAVDAMRESNPDSRELDVTIFYSDIRQFTTFCEGRAPDQIIQVLNRMMDCQVEEIEYCGGDVDKFIGDAVLARFEGKDRFQRAINAAIEIQSRLSASNMPLKIGIGIYSGPVVAGLLGTADRSDYTIIGDTVNVAARLCSSANATEIVSDVDTLKNVKAKGFAEPTELLVKGRTEPISVQVWSKSC